MKNRPPLLLLSIAFLLAAAGQNVVCAQRARLAVLDFGETMTGQNATELIAAALANEADFSLLDRAQVRPAARGAGYAGSLNMTLAEARALGAAIGCDLFITGDAQTIPRSASARPLYHEAYASVFIVSARTGRLIMWDRPRFEAATPAEAEQSLFAELRRRAPRYAVALRHAQEDERSARAITAATARADATLEAEDLTSADEAETEERGVRPPHPFRRLRPAYTEEAARADAEATVDALVEIGADGAVARVEIARWAGFGLDESVIATVRQLYFRPAMRDGTPVPSRVILRYNFRRPPRAANN